MNKPIRITIGKKSEMPALVAPPKGIKIAIKSALASAPLPLPFATSTSTLFSLCDLRDERGLLNAINCNELITNVISELIDATKKVRAACTNAVDKKKHGFRIDSFTRALDLIKSHPSPISSGKEAAALKGIGKGISARVDEILATRTLAELTEINGAIDPATRIIMELCQITGIGEARAKTLYNDHGVRGIDDLISKYKAGKIKIAKNQLTHHIAIGLEYYYDLQQRIPWAEVDQIRVLLEDSVKILDPKLTVTVCGSYRRKRPTCGDIDVLVTHSDIRTEDDLEISKHTFLSQIVTDLISGGFLVGNLTEHGKTKYMGVCKMDPDLPGRRIDIRFVPTECYPAALLYFTGSGQFNKVMRYKANERGYTINEYGIFTYFGGVKGDCVSVTTEKNIFDVINCVYLDPTQRNFE